MATIESLRSLIAEKFPGPAPVEETYFRTGVAAVDGEVGGLPRSALTECAGSMASGALMRHALIGAVVREGGFAALIDPAVGFDVGGLGGEGAVGVDADGDGFGLRGGGEREEDQEGTELHK